MLKTEYLVSIIIPAYNVEKYIGKCLESILNQSYDNIEVIVIDDGSVDNTLSIIENISKKDRRVILKSQINSGVSVARNKGINTSTGEYLVFVDGDDYLAEDYIEYMMGLVFKTNADFCMSRNCYTRLNESQVVDEKVDILSNKEATALLLSPEVIVGCWNKIFNKSFIINFSIEFSTELFYGEGLAFITKAAQLSEKVVVGNKKVYYYRRNNELSATSTFSLEKTYNGANALDYIQNTLTVDSTKIRTMFRLHITTFYLGAIVKMRLDGRKLTQTSDYKKWLRIVRKNTAKLFISPDISLYRKFLLLGGSVSPWLLGKLDRERRRKISSRSV